MSRRWAPLIASAAMLAAGVAYVVLWAGGPADCTAVDVRAESWQPDGVVVDVIDECPMRPGDLVTEVDGRPSRPSRWAKHGSSAKRSNTRSSAAAAS